MNLSRPPRRLLPRPILAGAAALLALSAAAQVAAPTLSDHVKKDVQRHRAMAAAHEGAARCLEAGRSEEQCQRELQAACKGLAIGKYCGMRHEH